MNFKKIINPGSINLGRWARVFCKITFTDGKLSIDGVEGPMPSGNCLGGCGQIDRGYAHRNPEDNDKRYSEPKRIEKFATGWTEDLWFSFLDIWKEWHLNDMTPGCEHQQDWKPKTVTVIHYWLKPEYRSEQQKEETRIMTALKRGRRVGLSKELQRLLNLPNHTTNPNPEDLGVYNIDGEKTKSTNWLRPEKHPEGYLCKPCPVCGYKYGTEWKKREVPQGILNFLMSLPDTTVRPAWV